MPWCTMELVNICRLGSVVNMIGLVLFDTLVNPVGVVIAPGRRVGPRYHWDDLIVAPSGVPISGKNGGRHVDIHDTRSETGGRSFVTDGSESED